MKRRPGASRGRAGSRPRSDQRTQGGQGGQGGDGDVAALPALFVRAARGWLGDEAPAFLAACARQPRLAIRAHDDTLRGGLGALRDTLAALNVDTMDWPAVPWWPAALLPPAEEGARLAAHPLARVGALYAQDPAALAAVAVLDPQPGERVLDLCAAPGGKSTAIADRLAGRGLLVANDVDAGRARELGRTLERWGVANAAVLSVAPEKLAARAPARFDRVLVDAPCSGEAMFGRHAAAAADWSPAHVSGCAARQRPLLDAARALVRPGGLLVYATCTFNPEENERVVAAYLAAHPDDTLEDAVERVPGASPGRPDLATLEERMAGVDFTLGHLDGGDIGGALTHCVRLWPHRTVGMGHFVAAIRVSVASVGEDSWTGTTQVRTRPIARESDRARGMHTGDSLARKSPGGAGVSPVPGSTRGRASSAARATRPQMTPDLLRADERSRRGTDEAGTTADDVAAVRSLIVAVAPGLPDRESGHVTIRGDTAYLVPPDVPPELAEVALAPGLQVAERRGRTWRPAHALAMALHPGQAAHAIALDEAAAMTFLAGHPVAIPVGGAERADGFALIVWHGYPLGWGRARDGILTSLLPKGLRLVGPSASASLAQNTD